MELGFDSYVGNTGKITESEKSERLFICQNLSLWSYRNMLIKFTLPSGEENLS